MTFAFRNSHECTRNRTGIILRLWKLPKRPKRRGGKIFLRDSADGKWQIANAKVARPSHFGPEGAIMRRSSFRPPHLLHRAVGPLIAGQSLARTRTLHDVRPRHAARRRATQRARDHTRHLALCGPRAACYTHTPRILPPATRTPASYYTYSSSQARTQQEAGVRRPACTSRTPGIQPMSVASPPAVVGEQLPHSPAHHATNLGVVTDTRGGD